MHLQNIHWIVGDDSKKANVHVTNYLRQTGIPFTYLLNCHVIKENVQASNRHDESSSPPSDPGFEYNAESNANITHIESVASSFDCDFDLLYYPFEVHLCEIQIALTQFGAYKAYFDTRMINLQPDNFTLTDFTTQPICYTFVNQSTNQANLLKIHIMLSRRYGAYILTTFLPCIVLTIIGSLTEFFEDDNFSDRINVTLAALIVIASLISQVAMTVPVSAQPKLIDMYFCFSMFRLFSCFVHHSLLCLVRCFWDQREKKREEKATNVQDSLIPLKDDDVQEEPVGRRLAAGGPSTTKTTAHFVDEIDALQGCQRYQHFRRVPLGCHNECHFRLRDFQAQL
ncbi:uncharacterized protein LOC135224129 [Macrobrachium nipponense]|uniref:uncharacterized protein LOC135224129 n=1 Tax=Macrobrachium nipponense TaxID=159736 RepID=UPI0030C7B35D